MALDDELDFTLGDVAPGDGGRRRAPAKGKTQSKAPLVGAAGLKAVVDVPNSIIRAIPPLAWIALDDAEVDALAKALDTQQRTSDGFRGKLSAVADRIGSLGIGAVLVEIAGRRFSRAREIQQQRGQPTDGLPTFGGPEPSGNGVHPGATGAPPAVGMPGRNAVDWWHR